MKGDKLVGFHLIGSHGPTYYKRYPDAHRQFTPDCPRSDIENCTDEELTNTYDNTIRYTDFVIGEMIAKLKTYEDKYNTALLYVSDHGESLGALGLYLHGTPYQFAPDDQTRVPMQVWMSLDLPKRKALIWRVCSRKPLILVTHTIIFSHLYWVSGTSKHQFTKRV